MAASRTGFGSSGYCGLGDKGGGDLLNGQGEVNAKHATDLARTPPNEFNATQGSNHYVTVTFKAPNLGGVQFYTVRRVAGSIPVIAKLSIVPGMITQANGVFSMTDLDSHRLKAGAAYSYFATATYLVEADGGGTESVESEISRVVTLNILNDPPAINVNIAPQFIATNSTTVALPFTVSDTESDNPGGNPLKDLWVSASATSLNAALIPQISFGVPGQWGQPLGESDPCWHTDRYGNGQDRHSGRHAVQRGSIPAPAVHAGDDEQHDDVHRDGECHRGDVRPGQRHPAGASHGGQPRRHEMGLYAPERRRSKIVH